MRHSRRRAALSGLAAAALILSGLPATTAMAGPAVPAAAAGADVSGPRREITLITGDRVRVDAQGRLDIVRGAGRQRVSHAVTTEGGRRYVIPSDAEALLADGRLDRRLFDVEALLAYADTGSLPLIVSGESAARSLASTGIRLDSLDATASTVDADDLPGFWSRLTSSGLRSGTKSRVWLDGRSAKPLLDQSVPQVGAPAAWAAGYDGTGVTVAVLDSGYDAAHPDLAGRVKEARDFTGTTPGAPDLHGHGTHVASTVAGTGAASNGRYKGVAPGASLLIGKVCVDYCMDSDMIAGMEWAAASGAAAVNMSIGGGATDGPDPVVEALERLTAETGTLFVVAAGNSGPEAGSVETPGIAPSALTVGSVTKTDQLSGFSSRGPAITHTVKPDLAAPGSDITAARASAAPGEGPYLTMSGTSMATPHVTGAVAILKQRHPEWKAADLKRALTGSAKDLGDLDAFEVGSGRLDVARALTQDVRADGPVSFGFFGYPQDQDTAVREITYTNDGDTPVTLSLAVNGSGPDKSSVDAFTLAAPTLTVPAHGTATAALSFDPGPGRTPGAYTAEVTATDATRSLRTVAGAELGREEYAVELPITTSGNETVLGLQIQYINRDTGVNGYGSITREDGSRYLLLTPGHYAFAVSVRTDDGTENGAVTFTDLGLDVRAPATLPIDLRGAGTVTSDITGLDGEQRQLVQSSIVLGGDGTPYSGAALGTDYWSTLRTLPGGSGLPVHWYLEELFTTPQAYYYTATQSTDGLPGARQITYPLSSLARVEHVADAALPGTGNLSMSAHRVNPELGWSASDGPTVTLGAPLVTYHSPGVWATEVTVWEAFGPGELAARDITTTTGQRQTVRWFAAPFSATINPSGGGVARTDGRMYLALNLFGGPDAAMRNLTYTTTGNGATLDVNGERAFDDVFDPTGRHYYPLPGGTNTTGDFVLNAWTKRQVPWSSRVSTSSVELHWRENSIPQDWRDADISLVRLNATGVRDGYAAAALPQLVSLMVEHQVAGPTKTLTFEVSYDEGKTWRSVPLARYGESALAVLVHPAGASSVSTRMTTVDSDGGTSKQTMIGSYGLR
ncbi:serine protease [Actinorhabdospora filicis]|uniref:Serine protease n=1 Tax=Actinorhabdospora filicis TaxID=1785913 RepID=A0A9W6SLS4_9ACTN|nr:S8 family serine peptidase [Actinorhabdospora filicis]GLZ78136.1 serine protease [Actinorhabdospora filicis]